MVFSPMEVGQDVEYTPEQVIADVSWTDAHPIKQVYLQCNCNTGQRMWDPMSVIHAVEGDSQFSLSERGTVQFTDNAETIFTPSPTGNCRYQLPGDAAWAAAMLERIGTFNRMRRTQRHSIIRSVIPPCICYGIIFSEFSKNSSTALVLQSQSKNIHLSILVTFCKIMFTF